MRDYTEIIDGQEVVVYRVKNDVNGNPRYVISWWLLGLDTYKSTKKTREAGLSIYRGKDFGGGFVFTSYSLKDDLKYIFDTLK